MNKIFAPACVSLMLMTAVAAGCGGGGGDDSDDGSTPVVRGSWAGALTLSENSCNFSSVNPTLTFDHAVAQTGTTVSLTDGDGRAFLGNTVGEDGFSVDGPGLQGQTVGSSITCDFDDQFEYDDIDDDDDAQATIEYRSHGTCTDGKDCTLSYTGVAVRRSSAQPTAAPTASGTTTPGATPTAGGTPTAGATPTAAATPTAGPTVTPTPTAVPGGKGACAQMTPSTYSGNGGCGFNEVTLRLNGGSVILEPLGVNGATSFAIRSSTTGAASVRSDLVVKTEAGYACSLACTPTSTFTIQCFKEGSESCSEKF